MYFPAQFKNVLDNVFWSKQKEKYIKLLQELIDGVDHGADDIDRYFASMIRPKNFIGRENEELRYDKSFEKNCIILGQYYNKPVKECTTREYFTLLDYYNNLLKEQRRAEKKRGRATNKA